MNFFFLGCLLISSSAFASLENFQGRYEVLSGSDGTVGCVNFDVVYDSNKAKLDVIEAAGSYVVYSIPSINKGRVDFLEDWGDGITKGTQINTFNGKDKVVNEVRVLLGMKLHRKISLTFSSNQLTIVRETDGLKKCILRRL